MRETKTVEFKECITNTFLKTVSAFANYGSGRIVFGINDEGLIVGLSNLGEACLSIENKINDSITPNPDYSLEPNERTGVIVLTVNEGLHKPYLYKAKAYKRNDTATVEVDRAELGRLVLAGQNRTFDATESRIQELSFGCFGEKAMAMFGINEISDDVLKTLELKDAKGTCNVAAELLSDQNAFPGIDIARFGGSINVFLDRATYENESVLSQFDRAVDMFRRYYQYEEVAGSSRVTRELVPEAAFREAVANALVHRHWDVSARIRISMFEDRIQVVSPGGLPSELSEREYLEGQVSILRNPILGNVLFRLGLIERFGTGVLRIKESYRTSATQPHFEVFENSISVTLPLLRDVGGLSGDVASVYGVLRGRTMAISEIAAQVGFGKSKTSKLLKDLAARGYVSVTGNGRGTKYSA